MSKKRESDAMKWARHCMRLAHADDGQTKPHPDIVAKRRAALDAHAARIHRESGGQFGWPADDGGGARHD